MKRMGVREFKESFHRVTEPIEVLNRTRTVGIYYPEGWGYSGVRGGDDDADQYSSVPGKYPPDHKMTPGRAPK